MEKKHIAVNTHLTLCILMFAQLLWLSILCANESEMSLCLLFAVIAVAPVFVFLTSPLYVIFSVDGIEIVYNFGLREKIKWHDIRSISIQGSLIGKGGGLPNYAIAYPQKGKRLFFVVGAIPKTRKTTKLIKQYYNKRIE